MQTAIYAGLRNGARDQQIHDALIYKRVIEVAEQFKLSPNTIRAASKRIGGVAAYELCLLGGVAQSKSEKSPLTHSGRLPSAHTAAITALSETLSCLAGRSAMGGKASK